MKNHEEIISTLLTKISSLEKIVQQQTAPDRRLGKTLR